MSREASALWTTTFEFSSTFVTGSTFSRTSSFIWRCWTDLIRTPVPYWGDGKAKSHPGPGDGEGGMRHILTYQGKSDSPGLALRRRCIESFGTAPHLSSPSKEAFARIVAVAVKNLSTWGQDVQEREHYHHIVYRGPILGLLFIIIMISYQLFVASNFLVSESENWEDESSDDHKDCLWKWKFF